MTWRRRSNSVHYLDPHDRLAYDGDLGAFVDAASNAFGLGEPRVVDHLRDGYEDCNLRVQTTGGTFVLKVFAIQQLGNPARSRRGPDVAERLVDVILAAKNAGMTTPCLGELADHSKVFRLDGLAAVAYEWIEGETYLHLGRPATHAELASIVNDAAHLHRSQYRPQYYHDIWAIPNFSALRTLVYPHLEEGDQLLVDEVRRRFDRIPLDSLPRCLVHGDLTKGNVIVTPREEPRIIDFSISNYTVRCLELVVIACNLMFDERDYVTLPTRLGRVTSLYESHEPLTSTEHEHLFDLCLVGCAMELLGGRWRQALQGDTSAETEYWLNLGRESLLRELAEHTGSRGALTESSRKAGLRGPRLQ